MEEGRYADIQEWIQSEDTILERCHLAALRAWDKLEELEKEFTPFAKIIQSSEEAFTDFFYKDWYNQQ